MTEKRDETILFFPGELASVRSAHGLLLGMMLRTGIAISSTRRS